MKNLCISLLLFFAMAFVAEKSLAQATYNDGLKVLNPNVGNWTKTAGRFESVVITLTPTGTHTNVDMLMEISAQGTTLANSSDSLEAEYKFSLPEGAVLHDAKLWMNNIPVKAQVYERNKAKMIYEALVSRRIDPLIIYQNDDYSFEARIYPVINPAKRMLSISYLVPNTITSKGMEVPLDLRMFRSDLNGYIPNLIVRVANSTMYGMPSFLNNPTVTLNGNYSEIAFPATSENLYKQYAVYFYQSPPSQFLMTQASGANEGFYQMMLMPTQSTVHGADYVFAVDYRSATYINYPTLLSMLHNKLKFNLSDSDRFNVVYMHNGTVHKLSPNWIAGDALSIDNAFATLPANVNSSTSSFFQVLLESVNFINSHGADARILMLSNAGSTNSNAGFMNQLISTTLQAMTNTYQVSVFDFNNSFPYALWNGSEYFYNNGYFFYNLSAITGGTYLSLLNNGSTNYYYNATSSFVDRFMRAFRCIKKQHSYDAVSVTGNSAFHSDYRLKDVILLPMGEAYMEVGRYINTPQTMQSMYYYGIDSNNYIDAFTLSPVVATDTFTKKIWGSRFIEDLIRNNSGNLYTNNIIQSSISYDVLCEYTALLALEPDTAGTVSNEVPLGISSAAAADKLDISVYPNPFEGNQRITCHVSSDLYGKDWTVKIFNTTGQLLIQLQGKTGFDESLDIDWNGAQLPQGIYLLRLEVGGKQQTLRVLKK